MAKACNQPGIDVIVKPVFFKSPSELRAWMEANQARATELWIGFYRKSSKKVAVTYAEALDEALCFGWIDGLKRRHDDVSYTLRFTPRRPGSIWSAVNTRRAAELLALGRMAPAGRRAYEGRDSGKSEALTRQRAVGKLDAALVKQFRDHPEAWEFFQAQPPGYRRLSCFWVMSAKREQTRQRRLEQLIGDSARRRRIRQVTLEKEAPV
jgi:uncharacterized protein YdeI (YjbR/CyaY-like superfamily)